MKTNTNTNTNGMDMAQAIGFLQGFLPMMQALQAVQAQGAGMAQDKAQDKAQAVQGAGKAGRRQDKAQAVQGMAQGMAQGVAQGKAQAQGAIEWMACKRKDEKALIGLVRDALIAGKETDALSCIKAWHIMVNKNKAVKDSEIVDLYRKLCMVAFDGKYATVKGTKDAVVVCKSVGRIKAWLYTWNRGDVKVIG